MFGSPIIETIVALSFLYFLLSLLCSTASEWIARIGKIRARSLESAIRALLADDRVAKQFYGSHIVGALERSANRRPSYISARTFATTVMDIVAPVDGQAPTTVATIRSKIAANPALQPSLKSTL